MKKLLLSALLVAVTYGAAKLYLHHRVGKDVDNVIMLLSPFADVNYAGVSSTMGGTLSIDKLTVTVHGYRDPVTVEKLSLITPGFFHLMDLRNLPANAASNDIPESLEFGITGFRVGVDSDLLRMMQTLGEQQAGGTKDPNVGAVCTGRSGFSPAMLSKLGYSELLMDLQFGYRKDDPNIVLTTNMLMDEMYAANIEATVQGAMLLQSLAGGSYRPRLVSAKIEYEDLSLNERTNRLCAESGLIVEEIIMAKIDTLNAYGAESGVIFDEPIIEPYREFLSGKSRFVLTARPNEPVDLTQLGLYKPSDVPALLNLEASAL